MVLTWFCSVKKCPPLLMVMRNSIGLGRNDRRRLKSSVITEVISKLEEFCIEFNMAQFQRMSSPHYPWSNHSQSG